MGGQAGRVESSPNKIFWESQTTKLKVILKSIVIQSQHNNKCKSYESWVGLIEYPTMETNNWITLAVNGTWNDRAASLDNTLCQWCATEFWLNASKYNSAILKGG